MNVLKLLEATDDITPEAVALKINELITAHNELVAAHNARSGPKSVRQMTEEDAKRIMLGDLKAESHTKAAETLQLSYGQIYSARKGFTFKAIYQEMMKAAPKAKA